MTGGVLLIHRECIVYFYGVGVDTASQVEYVGEAVLEEDVLGGSGAHAVVAHADDLGVFDVMQLPHALFDFV